MNPRHFTAFIDSQSLIYLHNANALELLPQMYLRITTVPESVAAIKDREQSGWPVPAISELSWIEIAEGQSASDIVAPHEEAQRLIALAREANEHMLIVEPRGSRRAADEAKVRSSGVIGVLLMARRLHLISEIRRHLALLSEAGMPITPKARTAVLLLAGEQP